MKGVKVLFGTQTFTSEYYSSIFKENCIQRYYFEVSRANVRNFSGGTDLIEGKFLLVLFLSTYGDGECTTDAREFTKYIKSLNPKEKKLKELEYVVFGLGNSKYRKFNQYAVDIDNLLKANGGKSVWKTELADGDETEDQFEDWQNDLLEYLEHTYKLKKKVFDDTPKPKYKIKWFGKRTRVPLPFDKVKMLPNKVRPFAAKILKTFSVIKPKENDLRRIIQIDLDLKKSRIMYKPGDHIHVYPVNPKELVAPYVERLGIDKGTMDKMLTLIPIDPKVTGYTKNVFPMKTNVWNIFKYYLDLTKPPSKKAIRFLAEYTKDEEERKELLLITSFNGKKKFSKKITRPRLKMIDVLKIYKNVKLPLEVFFEITYRLQPRVYSISSCYKDDKDKVSLLISKTNYKTSDGKTGFGICSKYLHDLKEGDSAYIFPEASEFYLPEDPKVPIILISVGCAFATFRSFLRARMNMTEQKIELGEAHMFYGCRNLYHDLMYYDEIQAGIKNKALTDFFVACSRDQKEKIYVQHILKCNLKLVYEQIKKGAQIYLCGTIRMSQSVYQVLIDCLLIFDKNINTTGEAMKVLDSIYFQEVTED